LGGKRRHWVGLRVGRTPLLLLLLLLLMVVVVVVMGAAAAATVGMAAVEAQSPMMAVFLVMRKTVMAAPLTVAQMPRVGRMVAFPHHSKPPPQPSPLRKLPLPHLPHLSQLPPRRRVGSLPLPPLPSPPFF
jgi:hypothetical protein